MATANQNLSAHEFDAIDASKMKIAIVVSEWNSQITDNLLEGAKASLLKAKLKKENLLVKQVPGSFELPTAAQMILEADQSVDAVICLGCVIQGETKHFDFVCQGLVQGIKDVSLKYNKAVIFGVLTDNTLQQSIDRSGGKHGNKGDEAAVSAIKMVAFQQSLSE